jgi:hypothetical protein
MIATQQTDQEIKLREQLKGQAARAQGLPITACPWNGGMAEMWWKQGWQGIVNQSVTAQYWGA